MSINDRIKVLIDLLANGRQNIFAEATDLKTTTINGIVGPRQSEPSFSTLKSIADAYPNINLYWLIKGEGEPLVSDYEKEEELVLLYDKIAGGTFLSGNLKLLRESVHESQESFARILGITRDNVASYERGSKPDLPLIIRIVKYFHISLEDFITKNLKEHPEVLKKVFGPEGKEETKK